MNPFGGYGKLAEGESFVGRRAQVIRLSDQIGSFGQNVNLVGEPRIGKSSLARRVAQTIEQSASRLIVEQSISVESRQVDIFSRLFEATIQAFQRAGNTISFDLGLELQKVPKDGRESFSRCERGLRLLAAQGVKVIWFLDEFDALSRYDEPRDITLRLREMISRSEYGLSCLAISRRPIASIEERISGVSNLKGVCPPTYLRPMSRDDIGLMTARAKTVWAVDQEDFNSLWNLAGGHPFLSQLVLYHSWWERSVKSAQKDATQEILEYYDRELRPLLEEDGLFDPLLQAVIGPRWSLTHENLTRLESYGLVNSQGVAFSGFFGEYLARCVRNVGTMDFVRTAEMSVRDLIEERAIKQNGISWLEDLAAKSKPVASCLSQAEALKEKDLQLFGSASPRLLDYFYFMDLWEIISLLWSVFEDSFPNRPGRKRQYWRQRFEAIAKVRNPAMHHREMVIPNADLLAARAASEEICDAIRHIRKMSPYVSVASKSQ